MSAFESWQAFWSSRSARERTGLTVAALALGAGLLWWVALSPALQTLKAAQLEMPRLQAQTQAMRELQAQAKSLQAQPRLGREDALRALELSVKQNLAPNAQLSVQGDRATLVLKGASADALARWLTQARINARAVPLEARLQRSSSPANATAAWDGSLLLALPAR